jgi:hypothetical protein
MESQIELRFFGGGKPLGGVRDVNVASHHPDITDVSLDAIRHRRGPDRRSRSDFPTLQCHRR